MSSLADSILESQNNYEQRFNCVVCLCPKLHMVYGTCQHRLCADCLYDDNGNLRASMNKCPTCQMDDAFPEMKPDIPDDNVEIMRCLGIRPCENRGCDVELWQWEVEEHTQTCPNRISTPKAKFNKSKLRLSSRKSSLSKSEKKDESSSRHPGAMLRRLRSFRRSSVL